VAALAEALRGRSLLIVLDNFEHVLDASPTVAQLAQLAPGLTWLVTSRARLRVAGEQVFEVAPLPLEPEGPEATTGDAVVLFGQVAAAVDPTFDLTANRADVEEICRAVDGLPLAIELAARHVHTLALPVLRARLTARLASATGATRDLPARQQTIPATIDWSLDLLGRAELDLFVRLGVFATPVPLETVELVCREPGTDLVDALTTLCDHSLVRRITDIGHEPRFGLLYLLRQRAGQLATSHDLHEVRHNHARWIASVLGEQDGTSESRSSAEHRDDRITRLMPDIRAAHCWAAEHAPRLAAQITGALAPYWHREGHHDEGRDWVTSSLADAANLDEQLVAQLHLAAGIVEWTRDQEAARTHWTRAIILFRALGLEQDLAYVTALAAVSHVGIPADYNDALRQCEDAIALARRVGHRSLIARVLNMKGELARVAGDDGLALEAYQEGLDLAVAAEDELSIPLFLGNLSFLAAHRGDQTESLRLSRDALQRSWAMGRRMMAAGILSQLAGGIHLGLGRPDVAARLIGASDEALSTLHVERHPCDVPEYERILVELKTSLSQEEFDRLRQEGRGASLDDTVALALETAPGAPGRDRPPAPTSEH
jgi:predicted ATPase